MRWISTVIGVVLVFSALSNAQGAKVKVLHNFGSTGDGSIPYGPLIIDSKGNLYGTTLNGGTCSGDDYGCGAVFELSSRANAWGEKLLYSFTGGNAGSSPWGGLVLGGSGTLLYGTLAGNSNAVGGVFELKRSAGSWTSTVLYTPGTALADGPGVVLDKLGNIYGEIGSGKYSLGAIGELSPGSSGWTYTDLYDFCATYCPDGWGPAAPPIWDENGNLWGVTTYGGISQKPCANDGGCGVVFEMTPNGDGIWTYNVIHFFASSSTDGQFPNGGLVADAAGNFYGNTQQGGAYNHGAIFKLTFIGGQWAETILYDFPNCVQACFPVGTMAIDKAGNLYGTTLGGVFNRTCGGFTCGEVFEMARQGNGRWKFSLLHKFVGTDGDTPVGVILDGKGNLFGTTKSGGTYGAGTAFELTP
jgi:uncharacterized repeat protein (TIGR03803 family)